MNVNDVLAGGPGWGVHRITQRMVATDPELIRSLMARTKNPLDKVGYAIALGALDEARQYLDESPESMRKEIFTGDVLRDEGRYEEAFEHFVQLRKAARGTAHEAIVLQHYGKCLFMAGRYAEAVHYLTAAIDGLRSNQDPLSVQFTELCIGEAQRRLGMPSGAVLKEKQES